MLLDEPHEIGATASDEMSKIIERMTPEQLQRYEFFRRAALPKAHVKKVHDCNCSFTNTIQIMQSITGSTPSPILTIVMAGICKVYVGEIVECGMLCSSRVDRHLVCTIIIIIVYVIIVARRRKTQQ